MHIAQLINSLLPAGAERVLADLSGELVRRGHRVSVISLGPIPERSPVLDDLRASGIEPEGLGVERHAPLRLASLGSQLGHLRADLVHAHLFHSILARQLVPRARRVPGVNTVHIADRRPIHWRFHAERLTRVRGDRITAVSHAAARFHADRLGIDPRDIAVVPNGIHSPAPLDAAARTTLRDEWGVSGHALVLGGVGRFADQKGFDRLPPVLDDLARRIPGQDPLGLVLLGDGPERNRLQAALRSVHSRWTVRLPGFRSDAASAMAAFDMLLVPSRFEGYGLVAAEAMAHGLPVVAQDIDSLPEVLEAHREARLVDFAVAEQAATAILELHAHPGRRTPLAVTSVKDMTDGYLAVYEARLGA